MRIFSLVCLTAVLAVLALGLSGCGGKHSRKFFQRENVDLAFVRKVAVLPLENNTSDQYAAKRIRDIVITQVLAMEIFDVVDRGIVDSRLIEEAINAQEPIDPLTLKRLGQRLSVQGFLMGAVGVAAGEKGRGGMGSRELSLTLRLLDANTGMVLWQASGYRNNESLAGRLFGLQGDDSFRLTLKLVRDLLATLPV